jgi:preprotein translocase subunit YajC
MMMSTTIGTGLNILTISRQQRKQRAAAERHVNKMNSLMSVMHVGVIVATVARALAASLSSPEFLDWVKGIVAALRR